MDISIDCDCDCVEEKTENQLMKLPNKGGMEDVLTQEIPIGEKVEDDRNPPNSCAMEVVLPPQVPNGDKIEEDGTKKEGLKRKMKKKEKNRRKKKTISPQVKNQTFGLVTEVLEKGDPNGKKVCKGAMVRVHVAMKIKDSDELPFRAWVYRLNLDNKRLIAGLRIGIIGMRVGDKRSYGDKGCKAGVPPNLWLVYEIKLLAHKRANL
ncbi:peptidyl-prolyl cis-trans isomerase FKBP43-like [Salvia splendens]|uniref:peptidyl-prolyl cis-trans isomerase FKBP43-like n=1 Tax=Salvia splendens TaxID=180675 RepID=UPI001C25ACB0|nr:peptidyl-prolyl cis-trans isomerase FKBP43-like [Salvia splendens]